MKLKGLFVLTDYFSAFRNYVKKAALFFKDKTNGPEILSGIKNTPAFIKTLPSLLDRRHFVFGHDLVMAGLALFLSFWMRMGDDFFALSPGFIFKHILVFGLVSACIFLWLQTYRGIWRYISGYEIMGVLFAAGYATALYFPLMVLMSTSTFVPRTTIFLLFLMTGGLLLSTRVAYRFTQIKWLDEDGIIYHSKPTARVLLVGHFQEISDTVKRLKNLKNPDFEVLGALSYQAKDQGRFIEGIEILGDLKDLKSVVEHFNLEDKHPHSLVFLSCKKDNLQALQQLARALPKLGLGLMHFKDNPQRSLELEPLSYKDLAPQESEPELQAPTAKSQGRSDKAILSKKRILLFGAEQLLGQSLSQRLLAQGQENLALSDLSSGFVQAFQKGLKKDSTVRAQCLPLSGTGEEDFKEILTEARPDLVLGIPPHMSESYFQQAPVRAVALGRRYMLGLLKAAVTSEVPNVVIIFPCNPQDFVHHYRVRYFNLLQAEMGQFLSKHESALRLHFLYTGEFAEDPDSLLNAVKSALENEEAPVLRDDLEAYEFSSLDRTSEKIINYLGRLYTSLPEDEVETHLQADMISTPEELLDQIKALYPLPYKAQEITFSRAPQVPQKDRPKLKPFVVQKTARKNRYHVKNATLLEEVLTSLQRHIQNKDDKNLLKTLT